VSATQPIRIPQKFAAVVSNGNISMQAITRVATRYL
jgi:hypothetical protein